MDLSIVTPCRNKDYGSEPTDTGKIAGGTVPFTERFRRAVSFDLSLLDRVGLRYEWIFVDWCSPGAPMHSIPILSPIFVHHAVRSIVVDESVSAADGLTPPDGFFEHFAKNVGIRRSRGRHVLILNGDVVLSEPLVAALAEQALGEDDRHYFRPRFHREVHAVTGKTLSEVDLSDKRCPDWMVAANFGGNFFMVSRKTMIEVAQGYDEVNPVHRKAWTHCVGMDGEILWNLYLQGISVKYLEAHYDHIAHAKTPEGGFYNQSGYRNRPDWGLVNYVSVEQDGVERITPCKTL
jgi:hypothetical protein